MPIYLLGSRTPSVEIPNQAVSISISGSVGEAKLYAKAVDRQHVIQVNPRVVIVPELTCGLTVGVMPHGTTAFSHGTIVHLAIGSDSPDEFDPVQIGFDPVNVSGCGAMELAALTPHGDRVKVAVRAVADVPLSTLASMARTAARRKVGSAQQSRAGSLSIGIDTSTSMLSAFGDGSVAAAIDAIVGVADVVGIRDVNAALVGGHCTPVTAPVAELAQAVTGASVRWSAGARWPLLPRGNRTIAITDSVNEACREGFPALRVSHDNTVRAAGPVLAAPSEGDTAERHLAANPMLIDELAAALLSALR